MINIGNRAILPCGPMLIRILSVLLPLFIVFETLGQNTSQDSSAISKEEVIVTGNSLGSAATSKKKQQDSLAGSNALTITARKGRLWLVAGAHAALWAGSYIALDKAWYKDYPKSGFHFFNDNKEWNQMDKAGHVWTAYQLSRLSKPLWTWAGMNRKQAIWLGGASAVAYQSIIEIQDGFSHEWGFSWGDMAANIAGAAAYVSQELGWKEQRIQIKLSYWPYDYSTPDLKRRRDQLFGKSIPERILKDYNSQTYWLSANLRSFLPDSKLPRWLNVAVGYSSTGMLGGMSNNWVDKEGNAHHRNDIPRVRRFFISPDIDLTKIRTRSKLLRSVLYVVNMVKVPAPALELNSKGRLRAWAIHW